MKIPSYSIPTAADQTDVPKESHWFFEAMSTRDEQISVITSALSRRLDRESNFNDEIRTVSVKHDEEVKLSLKTLSGQAIGIFVLWCSLYDYHRLKWEQTADGQIRLKVYFDSAPSASVTVRLLIMGGG